MTRIALLIALSLALASSTCAQPRATFRFDPDEFAPSSDAERELLYDADQLLGGVPLKDKPGTLEDQRLAVFRRYLAEYAGGKFTPIALNNLSAMLVKLKRQDELPKLARELLAAPVKLPRLSAAINLLREHAEQTKDPKEALAVLAPLSASADGELAFRADVGAAVIFKALDRHDDALKKIAERPAAGLTPAQKVEREHGIALILDAQASEAKDEAARTAFENKSLEHAKVVMKACEADPAAHADYSQVFAVVALMGMRRADRELAGDAMRAVMKLYPGTMEAQQAEMYLPQVELLGRPAPALDLKTLDGKPFTTQDLKGKIAIVDFWATTCPPCIAEAPKIAQLVKDLARRPFGIVSISLDAPGREPIVKRGVEKLGMTWPQVYDGMGWESPAAKAWGVSSLPSIFVVDETWTVKRIGLRGPGLRAVVEAELARLEKKK